MSGLDVEALLDSTAASASKEQDTRSKGHDREDRHKGDRTDRRDRDRHRDGSRDRDRDRKRRERSRERRRDKDGDEEMKSPKSERGSANGSHRSRKRSRSRDDDKRHSRRDRHGEEGYRSSGGDFYRGGPRRSRSKSPGDDRYYRPGTNGRPRRDDVEREDDRTRDRRDRPVERRRSASPKKRAKSKTPEPQLTEDERDRRTVFVQQLAARLRTKELIQFFEKVGPVKEAQIVKDRVSGRSKGYDTPCNPLNSC
jgi:RNA-binding protein 39